MINEMNPESLPGASEKRRNSDSTGTKSWLKNRLNKCFSLFLNLSIFPKEFLWNNLHIPFRPLPLPPENNSFKILIWQKLVK
jgi:hypothetical protein